ncbi:hypothetical protein MYCTH_2059558 [Thermothelomyces thermophilus ATCC 42464]|uniref:Xylanolytic transcriptional activator regulatory domain-containing protein n=1 Tax=Thermothelomyces thermophilus (strain ATCC 42464 / BCRC 31852 / DSM 1799) TaxID=573729 RepID=G2QAI2_THET4|nr:uncharacterized protein MYCTH_2059558 [Thermothelomyces thermophilus ATCC 42464]AEO55878.1 hypothetical protein MYCTH_2059558 [Thermothelomyces thermophilus ATCC 42464]
MGNDLAAADGSYPDYLPWSDFQDELDRYPSTVQLTRQDTSLCAIPNFANIPSPSELVVASSRTSINTPETSVMSLEYAAVPGTRDFATAVHSDSAVPEFEAVVLAEAEWNLARCNPPPPPGHCPKTAVVHLRILEQKSKQEDTWSALEEYLEKVEGDASDLAPVVPISSCTRDKLLAITQSFLHKALEIHRRGHNSCRKSGYCSPGDCNFIVLPPPKILEYFLRSYLRSLTVYYPLVTAGCVDPNEMLQDNQASTLLVLLMIAQGAAAMPLQEARYLSAGLTETCRISLFDIVEKDMGLSADPTTLRCALLFLVLGAWSGDKWLMDIAMGQRGMYMSTAKNPKFDDNAINSEVQWRAWVERETRHRLVYNYVMLDQELSLFHDTAPLFAITELQCPLPAPEVLWMSADSAQWLGAMQSLNVCTVNGTQPIFSTAPAAQSLHGLFQEFLQDHPLMGQAGLSPQHLRLLLHPLQAMVCHLRQMVSCFSDVFSTPHPAGCPVTKESILHRLDEVQALLQKWYDITMNYSKTNPGCPATHCNLIMYHLVSLNTVADFSEIERLARREEFGGLQWELPIRHGKCIFHRQKAIIHCGQVIRLLRLMPKECRPAWWPAAMYRAMLTLWADSISRVDPNARGDEHGNIGSQESVLVMIDQLTLEHPALINYLWSGNGMPLLTQPRGTQVGLDDPGRLLTCAINDIETCYSSRIGEGIKRKLISLGKNWNLEVSVLSPSGAGC